MIAQVVCVMLVFSVGHVQLLQALEYEVKSNDNCLCTETCYTLNEYVLNSSFHTSATFMLHAGKYYLDYTLNAVNIFNISLIATSTGAVTIKCRQNAVLNFSNMASVMIRNVVLDSCGSMEFYGLTSVIFPMCNC